MFKKIQVAILIIAFGASFVGCSRQPAMTPAEARPNFTTATRIDPNLDELKRWSGQTQYTHFIAGRRVGRVKTDMQHDAERGVYVIACEANLAIDVNDLSLTSICRSTETYSDRPPFALLAGEQETECGSRRTVISVSRDPDATYRAEIGERNATHSQKLGKLDYALGDSLAIQLWLVRNTPKPGESICTNTFSFDNLAVIPKISRVKEYRTETGIGTVAVLESIDDDNLKATTSFDSGGMVRAIRLHDEEDVREEPEHTSQNIRPLNLRVSVPSDRDLGQPKNVVSMSVRIEGPAAKYLSNATGQIVIQGDGVAHVETAANVSFLRRASSWEIMRSLRATAAAPAEDETVKIAARNAVGSATSRAGKVRNLVDYVHQAIRYTSGVKPVSVIDALNDGRGDCTTYAAVFTALARSAGIPTRTVGGFAYNGAGVFGPHAWNEVVDDDNNWRGVDACFGEPGIDGTHLRFGDKSIEELLFMHELCTSTLTVTSAVTTHWAYFQMAVYVALGFFAVSVSWKSRLFVIDHLKTLALTNDIARRSREILGGANRVR